MKLITVSEAFSNAPPRSAAVLCLQGPEGATDMILCDWFTWLNIRRNPMISFSLPRTTSLGIQLREGDPFLLAFPGKKTGLKYSQGIRTASEKTYPEGVDPVREDGLPFLIPRGSEVILRCTLAGAYNYPFKKVRIHNCNLEEAFGDFKDMLD